jgi:methylenetetrahydrofolate dehydrogenase (NADP+)/methenyltetrahydrofolate cyclohydrolase
MTEQILGGKILKAVKERCEPYREYFRGKLVTIVMFEPPVNETDPKIIGQYQAAVTSTNQKVKTFQFLGANVNQILLPANTLPRKFDLILKAAVGDSNSLGIIVQNPIPNDNLKLRISTIPGRLDIDVINENHPIFKASATSEAIARIVQSFAKDETKVAVVGAKGFVGRGVVRLLEEDGRIECIKLDLEDSLLRTQEADIIVSATGEPELLDERHILPSHRLVVDSGFIPQPDGSIKGDVNRSAYDIPQFLTPVPGGVGPLQMAVLLERIVELHLEQKLEKWSIPVPEIEPLVLTAEELIVEAIETDIDLEP